MNPSLLSSATAAFREEALETLSTIEAWVLTSLHDPVTGNKRQQETCRLLHSLKGTAASFGHEPIAQVCHAIESVLVDDRPLKTQESDALLMAMDFCRQLLGNDEVIREHQADRLTNCLAILRNLGQPIFDSSSQNLTEEINGSVWQIDFTPHLQFFENGHDPLRIFRELRNLGPIKVSVFTDKLPDFADFDPFKCYLRWQITLKAELDYKQLVAQFEWVKHICDLTIDVLASSQSDRVMEPTRYKLNEANLDALLTISQTLQSNLQQAITLTNQLNQTDKNRLSRRNQAMKRQQQLLQQQLLNITMRPLADAFARLPRMAFDLAQKTHKQVQLHMQLAPIELDSMIIHALMDPLTHLLRNALAHGIEAPEQRQHSGKPIGGQIHISAEQIDEELVIRFSDDGSGLSEQQIVAKAKQNGINTEFTAVTQQQLSEWVFRSGFSTSKSADAVSGRGIGLDIVKQHVNDLGGEIELVSTQGKGCCFTICIPIQQSLVDVQIIRINEQTMALPLINLLDSFAMESNRLVWQRGKQWFITDDNRQVPLIDICKFLPLPANKTENESAFILLLNAENTLFAVLVDGLAEQTQLLIKSLRTHYRHIDGIKGIAVLPEGNLALLLDPSKLFESFQLLGDNKNDG